MLCVARGEGEGRLEPSQKIRKSHLAQQQSSFFDMAADRSTLRIGDVFPNFMASSTKGTIAVHDYLGASWGVGA